MVMGKSWWNSSAKPDASWQDLQVKDGSSELHATALNVAERSLRTRDSTPVMNVSNKIDRRTNNISIIHMPGLSSVGGVDPVDGILEAIALVYVLHHRKAKAL